MPRKITTLVLAMCLVFGLAHAAPADITDSVGTPVATLTVGAETMEYDMVMGPSGWLLPAQTLNVAGVGWLTLQMTTDISPEDPIISWGLTATNLAAVPTAFAFAVPLPIALPNTATVVDSSAVGGMTDLLGDGVAVTPTNASGLLQDNNVTPPNFTWSVGPAVAFGAGKPGALYAYGPFSNGPAAGPVVGAALFSDAVGFTLSPNGDTASLTGYCSIVPIPLPPSVLLLGSGLLGLLGLSWRRVKA